MEFNSLAWTKGRSDIHLSSFAIARSRGIETPDLLLAEADERLRLQQGLEAERLLRRATELAPDRADLRNGLARALAAQKRYAESIDALRIAVDLEPLSVDHRRDLAIVLLQDHQPAVAREILKSALIDAPADQLLLAHLALAHRELGDSETKQHFDLEQLVGVFDLEPPSGFPDMNAFNEALATELLSLHTAKVEPLRQSLRGGTQTIGDLFGSRLRHTELLRQRVTEAISQYIGHMKDDPNHPFLSRKNDDFQFNGSWSCRLRSGGYHANHVHAKGWISSAYYVSLPTAPLEEDGRPGWLKFGESNLGISGTDRAERLVQPAIGRLVLFPSYFWHGTVPFMSDGMRLTVAFDVVPNRPREASAVR
jgi:tetratricopeptide (TPR) repeat protein